MKKIKVLIATNNKDKFEIVRRILEDIKSEYYEFYNMHDFPEIKNDYQEKGSIEERAFGKANQIYSNIKENPKYNFEYIIGIDDGIIMKGSIKENVKDYIKDIIDDKYLVEGEKVEIARAYSFIDKDGNSKTTTTKIPFKYKKLNKKIEIKENSYPLSYVLTPVDSNKTISELSDIETNKYYMKYSEKEISKTII